MNINPLEVHIENRQEDYLPAYPHYRRSVFKRNRWFYIYIPLFVLFIAMAIIVSIMPHLTKQEWGVAWTGVLVMGTILVIKLYNTITFDLKVSKYLRETEAKGSFKAYLDLNGIKLNYKTHVNVFRWDDFSQMYLHLQYLSFQDHHLDHVLILPKGKMESAQWVELENHILKISDHLKDKENAAVRRSLKQIAGGL